MAIQDHLAPSERMLSVFQPFYATSYRVIRLEPGEESGEGPLLEIPYSRLISVDLVRRPNHPMMAFGAFLIILGLFLTPILAFSSIFAIIIGAVFLVIGAKGKPGYFQLHAEGLPRRGERLWQVEYNRSGTFIATLRSVIGQRPEF